MTLNLAHGVGRLYDLPVPLPLYLGGAALAVVAAFVVQALSRGKTVPPRRRIASAGAAKRLVSAASAVGLTWLLLLIVFAITDPGDGFTLAPLFFWVGFVVGGVLFAALVDGVWARSNPWSILDELARPPGDPPPSTRPPVWLGPFLVYALFWFELVSSKGFDPGFIVLVVVAYTLFAITFRSRFGESWHLADPFSILFGFAERSAPIEVGDDGIYYRGPMAKLVEPRPMPTALFASVFVLLASTTLDNARETLVWSQFIRDSWLSGLDPTLLASLALALFALPFLLPYLASIAVATRWIKDGRSFLEVARTYGWSLSPIGVAYVLAHNTALLIIGGPLIVAQVAGVVVGNTFDRYVPSPKLVWFLEIGFIVLGHVLGVVSAHRIAQRVTRGHRDAVKSHVALTLLMSLFTIGTLFLLSQPLIRR